MEILLFQLGRYISSKILVHPFKLVFHQHLKFLNFYNLTKSSSQNMVALLMALTLCVMLYSIYTKLSILLRCAKIATQNHFCEDLSNSMTFFKMQRACLRGYIFPYLPTYLVCNAFSLFMSLYVYIMLKKGFVFVDRKIKPFQNV